MTMIELEPQPRIDTLVRLPGGGEGRRTEYVGTAWFDGKPEVSGLMLRRSPNAPRGIRVPNFQASFFVPDSLAHQRAALCDAALSVVHRRLVGLADMDPGARSRPPRPAGRRRLPDRRAATAHVDSLIGLWSQ
jgi:hypothetical protein